MSSYRFKNCKNRNKSYTPNTTTRHIASEDKSFEEARIQDEIQLRFGFERYDDGPERLGWLLNMNQTLVRDSEWPGGRSAADFYFRNDNGETFKATKVFSPYFFIGCKPGTEGEVEDYLHRRFEGQIEKFKRVRKEDLKQANHLVGHTRNYIQLLFRNQRDMISIRRELMPIIQKNKNKRDASETYADIMNKHTTHLTNKSNSRNPDEALENLTDIREHDIPFHIRMAIDLDIRVGLWYIVKAHDDNTIEITLRKDLVHRPDPVVLAFDIETTKLPLKFPDVEIDQIMMISYMIDGWGYLITNREIVSQDIEDFEYTPKPEYEGPFTIFNEENEKSLLHRFFEHIQNSKPSIFVTYNGDFFDWPFVEGRAKTHGIDMYQEIGVYKDEEDEYKCKHASHMDAFRWVQRDSYLPTGSQGLKAVTTAKLGYNPLELDPEDMTRFANEQPQVLAHYSVSDAVATYYLYMKYVHPFIYSLCNIIPMVPDEVLRKGTGTLCEQLLMVEAFKVNVIIPNKHVEDAYSFYDGHLLESETYVGGHVEALEAGVFRSDISTDFKLDPSAAQELIDQLDHALKFTIEVEENKKLEDVTNYEQVKQEIVEKLSLLRDNPVRNEPPLIYHLDVAAMYPNIILTNRLQPDAMIDEDMCATCDFNTPDKTCDRRMKWLWRGEYSTADYSEFKTVENLVNNEMFKPGSDNTNEKRTAPTEKQKENLLRERLKEYAKTAHTRAKDTKVMERESIICQRENPFYIETVRAFRDRRYEYKGLHKTWKGKLDDAIKEGSVGSIEEAKNMIVLFDSLQLAHKCILNSFYGYVMRPGARWRSLEMAGIVCLTGSNIIQMAKKLVERLGRPLELDTDGIWCILPKSFPETFNFTLKNGKSLRIHYPCTMLNHLVHAQYTNDQYQHLQDPNTFKYTVSSENSIFFEIDGPYRAMVLPSSTEEDKLLKKRYAVFDMDGSLAELKGFEIKRRGELKLVKIFQTEIFSIFLQGQTLKECYAAVAEVANRWLDVLFSEARYISDEELFELITENKSMSKPLSEYGEQKSTSVTTAKRLSEFLGDQMVKDKGLACSFIISSRPFGLPVSERAIPVAIFQSEESVKKHYLRKWLNDNSLTTFDIRDFLDWNYYIDRFGSVIQKIITIPAAMQGVLNPVPRVKHPRWLDKRIREQNLSNKQSHITDIFKRAERVEYMDDIEGFGVPKNTLPKVARVTRKRKLPEVMPDMHQDYFGWLAFQKEKWAEQRLNRERNRKALGGATPGRGPQSSVGNFFRRQTGSLVTSLWQIVQIAETGIPGEHKMWILVQDQLFSIRLTVPRKFYLNCTEEDYSMMSDENIACEFIKCSRTLPRSYPSINLLQVIMPESEFQEEETKTSSLFNHPMTDSVFETQVPLLARAVLDLGAVCQFEKASGASTRRIDDQFNLAELRSRSDQTANYMSDPKAFHYIYLSHSCVDSRQIFALVGPTLATGHIFVVGVSQNNQQVPNLGRIYREIYETVKQEDEMSDIVPITATMEFETNYHTNERSALKALNKALSKYQDSRKGKTVLAIDSPRSSNDLIQQAQMISEFPFIRLSKMKQDRKMDALNWIMPTMKQLFTSYMKLSVNLQDRLSQARYANVPFCNIPEDSDVFVSDVLFARTLIKNDMVIWWSDKPTPDLGALDEEGIELVNSELNQPGAYETVCADFELSNLCLNTLMASPMINELEGSTGPVFGSNNTIWDKASFGGGVISTKTLSLLRSTVRLWLDQKNTRLAGAFQRWIMTPNAAMYDPRLCEHLHNLMKKVFMQFVSELKRLGAKIIFANFHRILVTANKDTAESALSYYEYLNRTVGQKNLFDNLVIKHYRYWDVLLWMDEWNHAGVLVGNYTGESPAVTRQWSIEEHLSDETMKNKFVYYTSMFIYYMTQNKRKFPREITVQDMETDDFEHDERSLNLQRYVSQEMAPKITRWLKKISSDQSAFHIDSAVEFVKIVFGVLNLDPRVDDATTPLKRALLDNIAGLSDFSEKAQFRNPVPYYKLTNVCCSHCNHITDLDFRRDPELQPGNDWKCKHCASYYNKLDIELSLIAKVNDWVRSFQEQDLECVRCHKIRMRNFESYCDKCGGNFAFTQNKQDLIKNIQILKTIAVEHHAPLLEEVAESFLKGIH
ncbi:unnamed protein product [Rhizopus stolonifer]